MNVWTYVTLVFLAAASLAGCEREAANENVAEAPEEDRAYDIYLKNKEKSGDLPSRDERLAQRRNEKERLASAILAEGVIDKEEIERAVEQYRSELVINRYFGKILTQQVSDEAVRKYFDEHPEEFVRRKAILVQATVPFDSNDGISKEQAFDIAMKIHRDIQNPEYTSEMIRDENPQVGLSGGIDVPLNSLDELIQNELLGLGNGEVTSPLLRGNEYVVLKLTSAISVEEIPFEQASEAIRFKLNNEIKLKEMQRLLAK